MLTIIWRPAPGCLGIIHGFSGLPDPVCKATDSCFNQDVTGDLPRYDSVTNIARRTQLLAEEAIRFAGGTVYPDMYYILGEE
ncbi:MAG: hypothetical protein R3293_28420 [Candidatus Promineifilaceae bacterium]|nr:hypothetical protein [Candidatus Promineifilaceae bacterium]